MRRQVSDTILGAIGHTPHGANQPHHPGPDPAEVLAKIETFNPGNSIKDRMAVKMIEEAERAAG